MKQFKTILLLFLCFTITVNAQKWKLTRYEAIVGIGTANYFGDIGGSASRNNWFGIKDIDITSTRASLYLGARYKITTDMALRANFIYGFMQGNDNGSKNSHRQYSFSSNIIEPSVQFEYSLIQEEKRSSSFALFNRRGMVNNYSKIALYVFAGVGGLYYYPFFSHGAPLFLNESINKSNHFTFAIPAGIGLKYILNSKWCMAFDFTGRYTGADNLEGLNPASGFSKFNDVYYFGTFQLIYRLRTSRSGWPILSNKGFQ